MASFTIHYVGRCTQPEREAARLRDRLAVAGHPGARAPHGDPAHPRNLRQTAHRLSLR